MKSKEMIKEEGKEVFGILNMIRKRKFVGFTGLAVKNSTYQFLTTGIAKGGSLIFTIIIARMLLPELFGLYSLALSTIIIFASFSDLGINWALTGYISQFLGKNKPEKAKAYLVYLTKVKLILIILASTLLIVLARVISNYYYHQPISLALVAGSLYILALGFISVADSTFFASNNFKYPMYKEILFQILRLIFVPLAVLLTISSSIQQDTLFWIILALSMSYLVSLIYILVLMRKKISFVHEKSQDLSKQEKKSLWMFILPLSATALSGVFFGYIDIVMLGRYVLPEFIGYYKAAFSLISGLVPIISFAPALFPLFSRLKGKRLERGFKKSMKFMLGLSVLALIGTLIFAGLAVRIVFGTEYSQATNILRLLAVLLLFAPISLLYESYFISQGKTKLIAILLWISTILNIILNYILITWLVQYSFFMAVVGAAIATLISRFAYLFGLMIYRKKL